MFTLLGSTRPNVARSDPAVMPTTRAESARPPEGLVSGETSLSPSSLGPPARSCGGWLGGGGGANPRIASRINETQRGTKRPRSDACDAGLPSSRVVLPREAAAAGRGPCEPSVLRRHGRGRTPKELVTASMPSKSREPMQPSSNARRRCPCHDPDRRRCPRHSPKGGAPSCPARPTQATTGTATSEGNTAANPAAQRCGVLACAPCIAAVLTCSCSRRSRVVHASTSC